jgi:hypothetical protein
MAVGVIWIGTGFVKGEAGESKYVFPKMRMYGESKTFKDSIIHTGDVGAPAYYMDAHVLDMFGLTWPPALHIPMDSQVQILRPKYHLALLSRGSVDRIQNHDALRGYRPIIRFSPVGDTSLTLLQPSSYWPLRHDYLLYERVDK